MKTIPLSILAEAMMRLPKNPKSEIGGTGKSFLFQRKGKPNISIKFFVNPETKQWELDLIETFNGTE